MLQVEGAVSAGCQVRRRHRVPHRVATERHPRLPRPDPPHRLQPVRHSHASDHVQHHRERPERIVWHRHTGGAGHCVHPDTSQGEGSVQDQGAGQVVRHATAQHPIQDDVHHIHICLIIPLLDERRPSSSCYSCETSYGIPTQVCVQRFSVNRVNFAKVDSECGSCGTHAPFDTGFTRPYRHPLELPMSVFVVAASKTGQRSTNGSCREYTLSSDASYLTGRQYVCFMF